MKSLEEFLAPGAIDALNQRIDEEKQKCATLAAQAQVPKGGKKKNHSANNVK